MSARERFEQTRANVARLNEIKLLIMNGCDDWKPPNVHSKTDTSDPTANQAIYNVDTLEGKLAALRAEETELENFIGESLRIITAVHVGFGEIYAHLLEWRYIDGYTWTRIHDDYGIKKSNGHYLLDVCFEWIDSVGISRLLSGNYEL